MRSGRWKDSASGPWNREEAKRLVLGGGGDAEFFETVFAELRDKFQREQHAVAAGTFHAGGGMINYLVSGRKPA